MNVTPVVTSYMSDASETCPRSSDKKSKVKCSTCSNFVCNDHTTEERNMLLILVILNKDLNENDG